MPRHFVRISRVSRGNNSDSTKPSWLFRQHGGTSDRFHGDGGDRGAVIEVDIGHGVLAIVIPRPIDVVILHEQNRWNAGVGKDLAVGVEERASRIVVEPDLALRGQVAGHAGNIMW